MISNDANDLDPDSDSAQIRINLIVPLGEICCFLPGLFEYKTKQKLMIKLIYKALCNKTHSSDPSLSHVILFFGTGSDTKPALMGV